MLPARAIKKQRRASRWKSQAHRDFVREFVCCNCGSQAERHAAHVRMNSGAGIGQKPDDWRCVPLCAECHNGDQHTKMGEPAFWAEYKGRTGQDVEALIEAFIKASPKRAEIEAVRRERDNG